MMERNNELARLLRESTNTIKELRDELNLIKGKHVPDGDQRPATNPIPLEPEVKVIQSAVEKDDGAVADAKPAAGQGGSGSSDGGTYNINDKPE